MKRRARNIRTLKEENWTITHSLLTPVAGTSAPSRNSFAATRRALSAQRISFFRDAADAEDAVQEGLVNAYNAIGKGRFREGSAFRPWLLKIVVNQSLNIKSRKRRIAVAERAATESVPPEYAIDETLIDRERARLVYQALDALKEQERVVVYLRYFLALPERELAEYLGVPPGTVKFRLHRALAKLREIVARDYPGLMLEMNQ